MEIVQYLNELAYLQQHIILLSIDPQTFTDHQLRIIEKECSRVEPLFSENLSTELMDIIKIANMKSLSMLDFGYNEIISELGISKPTARKRISSLIQQEYLKEKGTGKRRQFSVTDKGRKIFRD
jgi:predicted transcriptional regulator